MSFYCLYQQDCPTVGDTQSWGFEVNPVLLQFFRPPFLPESNKGGFICSTSPKSLDGYLCVAIATNNKRLEIIRLILLMLISFSKPRWQHAVCNRHNVDI